MSRLVLIDTLNFFHRAFHAFPMQLSTPDGQVINAVYGFASMLFALAEELKPTHLAVAFESEKEPIFRSLELPAYKATRVPKPPEEQAAFDAQIPLLLEFLRTAEIRTPSAESYEADDVIGTIARKVISNKQKAIEVIIASNDRDLMQLIHGNVRFYLPAVGIQKAKMYGERDFLEEFGFKPAQLIEYKSLRGDPSDNIPGVRGIGEKTASELVKKYGTLEKIYKHLLDLKPVIAQRLNDGKKDAFLSRKIATIITDIPLDFKLENFRFRGFDQPAVLELFRRWGFKSLLGKLSDQKSENSDQAVMQI